MEEKIFDFEEAVKNAQKMIGHVNIVIAGKTGVGKSTLINAVFGEDLAETGIGQPVTQTSKMYTKEDSYYSILDTKGFELEGYQEILTDLKNEINRRKTADPKEHIHLAWYCIQDGSNRIEQAEIDFINELADNIPVIVILTQASRKKKVDFYNQVKEYATKAKQVIRVLAKDDDDFDVKAYGLDNVIEVTYGLLPEASQKAFAAAQKIDVEMKKKAARKVIKAAVAAGTAACAIPLPFADSAILAPIEVSMLAGISLCMGLKVDKAFLATLVSSAIGIAGAMFAGRAIVTGLLKLIPGIGTIVGAAIGATTAAAMITALGESYIAAILKLNIVGMKYVPDDLAKAFKEELKSR